MWGSKLQVGIRELQEGAGKQALEGWGMLQKGWAAGRELQEGARELLVHGFVYRATSINIRLK